MRNMMKNSKRYNNICLRALTILCLMMASMGAWAADYVIYNNGYYLAYDGSLKGVTAFDPATCIWTSSATNNGSGTFYITYDGNTRYLRYNNGLTTSGQNNATTFYLRNTSQLCRTRTSNWGTYTYSNYLRYNNGWVADGNAQNNCYAVTPGGGSDFSVNISSPTPDQYVGNVGGTMTISAQVSGNYAPAYYYFNAKYYYTTNGTTYTEANSNPTVYQFDYKYEIISGGDNATISGNTVTYTKDAGEDVEVTVRATANPRGYASVTRSEECTFTLRSATLAKPIITRIEGTNKYEITYPVGAKARYSIDGTDINEYASNGTEYTDVITVTTPGAVIKARAVRDGVVSAQTEYTVSDVILDAPVISIADDGTVTITNPNTFASDATIYYTTDGSEPTASSATYGSSFTVSNGATVKAIISKAGYTNSKVAEKRFVIESGVSDGVVTLNDYEDHTWTYYAGVDTEVDGGNYNTNYVGKLYSPNPRNVKITYYGKGRVAKTDDVNGEYVDISNDNNYTVKVGINEPENTFVYYKTLERDNNSRYPYTTIPNPFSVRPVYGTNTTTKWRGFYRWRVKSVSDGGIYAATTGGDPLGVGSYLEPDKEYFFQPSDYNNDNYTINGTSMTVELEAVWARAYVNTSNSTTNFVSKANGGWERNFVVYTSGTGNTATGNANYPITYTALFPNGSTTNNGAMATAVPNVSVASNMTLNGDVKIENIRMNGGSTLGASYKNLWIGHGVTGTGTNGLCATLINGGTTTSTASPQYHIRIESGVYQYMSFFTGYYTNAGGNGGNGFTVTGSNTNAKITLGCDYDRASKTNTNLQFQDGLSLGRSGSFANGNRANKHTLDLTIKSGRLAYNFFSEVANTDAKRQGGAGYGFYLSSGGSQTYMGTRNVLIEGGEMATVGSGIDSYNNTTGTSTTPSTTTNYGNLGFNFRMRGGVIHGNVYGGAAKSPAGGNRVMVVTGGQIKGWFAAGCNGTDSDGGQTYGTSWVYIGGNGKIDSEDNNTKLGYASGGNVYAAGAGMTDAETCGEMTFGTNLVLADDGYVERGVYGGGNYGYAKASTNIYITGGTNEGKTDTQSSNAKGGVYGGANQQDGPGINIWMTGGKMYGGVYGGCNTKGTITGDVTMQINGGQVGQDAGNTENIHGGGYGDGTSVPNNVEITLGTEGQTTNGVKVYGNVYGGAALGTTGGTGKHTYVKVYRGSVTGDVFGGGMGEAGSNTKGVVTGTIAVDVYGTDPAPDAETYALHGVYGGGDLAPYAGTPTVKVHNCDNSIEYVYGGGNATSVAGTDVTIWGGNKIGNVFGGGNGQVKAANVNGNAVTKIYGGTILNIYGGSNSSGNITGDIKLTIDKQSENSDDGCPMYIGTVYGGGNAADSKAGQIKIGCTGAYDTETHTGEGIETLFGGANAANIDGSIDLKISGGHIGTLYGGNNASGTISGKVDIAVAKGTSTCGVLDIGTIYGGGKMADMAQTANVVTISVTGDDGKTIGNIYGGGEEASVYSTSVTMKGGTVTGNIFGGGKGVAGSDKEMILNGGTNVHVYGGTVKDIFGGNDAGGSITGNLSVEIDKTKGDDNKMLKITGDVYGGGNQADSQAGSIDIVCANDINDVYGGAKNANVTGNIELNVGSGQIQRVFGGNNVGGNITGSITVNVEQQEGDCGNNFSIGNVYGGGNQAAYVPTTAGAYPAVNIKSGTITNNVFGGGLGKTARVTSNPTVVMTGGTADYVYGGGEAAPVTGNTSVSVSATVTNDVFAGGLGTTAAVSGNTSATVNGGSAKNVYGGGAEAAVGGSTTVTVTGASTISENVFGGGKLANVTGGTTVTISNDADKKPAVTGDVYGGGALADVGGNTSISLTGGSVGSAYGGGLGAKTGVNGATEDVAAIVGGNTLVTLNGSVVTGQIFGANNLNGTPQGSTKVQVTKTTSRNGQTASEYDVKAVYGGGNLAAYIPSDANLATAVSEVYVEGCDNSIEYVYGGGNAAPSPATKVTIEGGKMYYVFGGGNGAGQSTDPSAPNYNPGADVGYKDFTYDDAHAYGMGTAVTNIYGGVINTVFGGSNTKGNIRTSASVNLDDHHGCDFAVGEVYGAGNEAEMYGGGNLVIGCIPGLDNVFGGAKKADVFGDVNLTITNGTFKKVFGGNNLGGCLKGGITVNIEETGCTPIVIGELYGGGYNAAYSVYGYNNDGTAKESGTRQYHDPIVNVRSFTNIGTVYGGGEGADAVVYGNPTVNIEQVKGKFAGKTVKEVAIPDALGGIGTIFGGGNAAKVVGSTTVNVATADKTNFVSTDSEDAGWTAEKDVQGAYIDAITFKIGTQEYIGTGNVYGGGNQADVTGKTNVTIGK